MRKTVWPLLVALLCASPTWAAAYYVGELTTRAMSRGGANIVNPGDPSAVWLNPAAITKSTGLQLQLNNNVVWLGSSFTRACPDPDVLCGPRAVNRSYGDQRYSVDGERPPVDDNNFFSPNTPAGATLGSRGTPSRFDDGHSVSNQSPPQYIPQLFVTLNMDSFGLPGLAVGGGVFGPNAGDYRFPDDEVTRYNLVDRDLLEVFYMFTVAYNFKDLIAVGGSIQGVASGLSQDIRLSADRFGNESPESDIGVRLEVFQPFVPSANFGIWSNPFLGLELGASVQLGRRVNASGPLSFTYFGEDIEELMTANGDNPPLIEIVEDNPTAHVAFTMPPFYRVGAKYGHQGLFDGLLGFDVELDFVYEQWSVFDHVSVSTTGVGFSVSGGEPLALDPIVQPKNYQDSWSVRGGGEVNFFDKVLQFRGGGFYETAAIPTETLSVDLLNGDKVGVGVGASLAYFGVRLDVGYSHLFVFDRIVGNESIVHADNVAPSGLSAGELRTRPAMGTYQISYDVVSVALNVAFDEMLGFGAYKKAPWDRGFVPYFSQYWLEDEASVDAAVLDELPPEAAPTDPGPVTPAPVTPPKEPAPQVPGPVAPVPEDDTPVTPAPVTPETETDEAPVEPVVEPTLALDEDGTASAPESPEG